MSNGISNSGDIREALDWGATHPLILAKQFFPFKMYECQVDSILAASTPHSRVAVSWPNEAGKTSCVIPVFGLSAMVAFPGCNVYSTSGSERQVREQLFDQQLRPLLEQKKYADAGWKISVSQLKVTAPNGSTWLGYVCKDAMNVEGFHGYWREDEKGNKRYFPCIYLLDECKSIADNVYEAVKRIDPDFEISVSTPGKESGWFYDAIDPETLRAEHDEKYRKPKSDDYVLFDDKVDEIHDYRAEYSAGVGVMNTYRRMVDWTECPHLMRGDKLIERNNIRKKYGPNSAFVKSMLEGRFQRSEEYNLIYSDEDLNLLREAMLGHGKCVGDDIRAAGDVSGGGDEQILMIRIGSDVIMTDTHQCQNELDQADYWVSMLRKMNIEPWQFAVDGGGLGATVANYMETRLGYRGVKRCQANTLPTYKHEFRDKYTEIHFFIKELLSAGVLKLNGFDKELLKQARSRRYIEMELGEKIKTEAKPEHRKREKCSPDRLDTLIYLFYDFDRYLLDSYGKGGNRTDSKEKKIEKRIKTFEEAGQERMMSQRSGAFSKLRSAGMIRTSVREDARIMRINRDGE